MFITLNREFSKYVWKTAILTTILPMLPLTKYILNEKTKVVLNLSTLISSPYFWKIKYCWRRSGEILISGQFPVLSELCHRWEVTQEREAGGCPVQSCSQNRDGKWHTTEEQVNSMPYSELWHRHRKWPRISQCAGG